MPEIKVKVDDVGLLERAKEAASSIGVDLDELVVLSLRSYLASMEAEALEREFYSILERVEKAGLRPTEPFAAMAIGGYMARLREIKRLMDERRRMLRESVIVEGLGKAVIGKEELERLGKVVVRKCVEVVFRDDVDEKTFNGRVVMIYAVNRLVVPDHLYAAVLAKARMCGLVVRGEGKGVSEKNGEKP